MNIKLEKIKRHWWCPLITKEVILKITPDKPMENEPMVISGETKDNEEIQLIVTAKEKSYIQPMCKDWDIEIKNGSIVNVDVDY